MPPQANTSLGTGLICNVDMESNKRRTSEKGQGPYGLDALENSVIQDAL